MAVAENKVEVGGGFHFHLYRGSDLLSEDKPGEALEAIEEALALQPDSPEAMSLHAAALFKLDRYDDAIQAYRLLIKARPKEQALYVNLALVLLKADQLDEAEAELRQAMAVGGESKRLHGYLGLVYSKKREYEKALIAFNKASAAKMVSEMEELIRKRQKGAGRSGGPSAGESEIQKDIDEQVERSRADVIDSAQRRRRLLLTPESEKSKGQESPTSADEPVPTVAASSAEPSGVPLGKARRISAAVPSPSLAVLATGLLRVDLSVGAICALGDLAYSAGVPKTEPLFKRFKGRTTKSHFGSSDSPFCKVGGEGPLLLQARSGRRLFIFEMAGKETAFVAERALYAFSAGLAWENGRIGASEETSMDLVTLSGTGLFCVAVTGEVSVVEASEEGEGVLVGMPALVGWQGRLIPRPVPAPEGLPPGSGPYLRLKGTGRILLGPVL